MKICKRIHWIRNNADFAHVTFRQSNLAGNARVALADNVAASEIGLAASLTECFPDKQTNTESFERSFFDSFPHFGIGYNSILNTQTANIVIRHTPPAHDLSRMLKE
jgi:hypothetical protein